MTVSRLGRYIIEKSAQNYTYVTIVYRNVLIRDIKVT